MRFRNLGFGRASESRELGVKTPRKRCGRFTGGVGGSGRVCVLFQFAVFHVCVVQG